MDLIPPTSLTSASPNILESVDRPFTENGPAFVGAQHEVHHPPYDGSTGNRKMVSHLMWMLREGIGLQMVLMKHCSIAQCHQWCDLLWGAVRASAGVLGKGGIKEINFQQIVYCFLAWESYLWRMRVSRMYKNFGETLGQRHLWKLHLLFPKSPPVQGFKICLLQHFWFQFELVSQLSQVVEKTIALLSYRILVWYKWK